MLDKLRDRVVQLFSETHSCTLATTGPAGIQASIVPCVGQETTLYLLVPDTSDHLFNLEFAREAAVTTQCWHLQGTAALVKEGAALFSADQRQWHTVVKITPLRLHVLPAVSRATHAETIDFDLELK